MSNAFDYLDTPFRPQKPRANGLTMVLDKNMGIERTRDLIASSSSWVDVVKLGWATSACMPKDLIAEKCRLLRQARIDSCPGGTLFELSFLQGRLNEMLREARELGFTCVEVSDGTIPISTEDKLDAIRECCSFGFRVFSEIGSKIAEEDHRISALQRVEQARKELKAGSWKVIMEARESGTLGIFQQDGSINQSMLNEIATSLNHESLIFEAPRREQQTALIHRFGNNVNLGNIAPDDLIPLETLRKGLRSDTLRRFHMHMPTITFELGTAGARNASLRQDVVIVVDALRATSTIATALSNGMSTVTPVATVNECVGDVTAGERGGKKIPNLDCDNSPLSFPPGKYEGKNLVITSTNGTECILISASGNNSPVLAGSLLNATSTAEAALQLVGRHRRNISIVIAGRNNLLAIEDQIAATQIALAMRGAPVVGEVEMFVSDDFVADFMRSDSGRNLCSLGRTDDVIYCAQKDLHSVVPILINGKFVPLTNLLLTSILETPEVVSGRSS